MTTHIFYAIPFFPSPSSSSSSPKQVFAPPKIRLLKRKHEYRNVFQIWKHHSGMFLARMQSVCVRASARACVCVCVIQEVTNMHGYRYRYFTCFLLQSNENDWTGFYSLDWRAAFLPYYYYYYFGLCPVCITNCCFFSSSLQTSDELTVAFVLYCFYGKFQMFLG